MQKWMLELPQSFYRTFERSLVLCLMLFAGMTLQVQAQSNDADRVDVNMDLLGPIHKDIIIGGASQTKAALRLNIDTIQRVMLKPDDLKDATLEFQLAKSDVQQLDVIAQGQEVDKTVIDLAKQSNLQSIEIQKGQSLAILIWRSQWHWNGGGDLTDFQITRLSDGKNFSLPNLSIEPAQLNDLGMFKLMAMSKREKFPVLKEWTEFKTTEKNGKFLTDAAGSQMRMSFNDNKLNFFTNGRAKFSSEYDWIPALLIEPKETTTIALSGKIHLWCGDPKGKPNMTWAVARYAPPGKASGTLNVQLHRALKPILDGETSLASSQLKPGVDYDDTPLLSIPFDPKNKTVTLDHLADQLKPWLNGTWENHGMVMQVVSDTGMPPTLKLEPKHVKASITVVKHPNHKVYDFPVKVQPNVYVKADGSRLSYGDQRLRLWGVAGTVGDASEPERLNRIGFNAIRLWPRGGQNHQDPYYPRDAGIKGVLPDSDLLDHYDRYVAAVKQQGMFIMCPFSMRSIPIDYLKDDQSFVAGGDDWQQWKDAVDHPGKIKAKSLWFCLDERLLRSEKQHIYNLLNHVNPYTGKRYAEEETVAVWELDNEAKIIKVALEDGFDTWPDYFKDKLQQRFNQWLIQRYTSNEALIKAWGKLEEGESLDKATVTAAPIFPQRTQYPQSRGDDFVHFMIDLVSDHYKQLVDHARAQAPTGVGVNVQPFSFDTQYRPNTPWQYSATEHADVANFGMYFFSMKSTLSTPPSMYVMDSHTMTHKPTVIYETNSGRPGKFRVEHAYRALTLASWQDWDAVFWHYYHFKGFSEEQYLAISMPYQTNNFYWSAVEFEKDPVMISTIGLAGQIFVNQQIKPAPNPVEYQIGKQGIFSYNHWNGVSTGRAAFERGATITYKPDADFAVKLANSDKTSFEGRIMDAIKAGDQVTWDWPNSRLIVDTPLSKVYVGKTPPDGGWYQFADGISVGQFDTDFAAFAITSTDGKPLTGSNASSRMLVNARFNAENTGFDMDMSIMDKPNSSNPIEQAKYIRSRGYSPIIEQPVAFSVAFPNQLDATLTGYDAAQRLASQQSINSNTLRYTGKAMMAGVLEITNRGTLVQTPQSTPMKSSTQAQDTQIAGSSHNTIQSNLYNPITVLNWSDSWGDTHRLLRESPLVFTNMTATDKEPRSIVLNDAQVMFNLPAEVTVYFKDNNMNQISIKFTQPPSLNQVTDTFNERFGKPTASKVSADAFSETRVTWKQTQGDEKLNITLTENQGVMQIIFER